MEEDEQALDDIVDGLDLDDSWEVVDGYEMVDPLEYYDEEYLPEDYYGEEDYYEIDVTVPEDLATPVLQDIVDDFDEYYPADNSTTAAMAQTM